MVKGLAQTTILTYPCFLKFYLISGLILHSVSLASVCDSVTSIHVSTDRLIGAPSEQSRLGRLLDGAKIDAYIFESSDNAPSVLFLARITKTRELIDKFKKHKDEWQRLREDTYIYSAIRFAFTFPSFSKAIGSTFFIREEPEYFVFTNFDTSETNHYNNILKNHGKTIQSPDAPAGLTLEITDLCNTNDLKHCDRYPRIITRADWLNRELEYILNFLFSNGTGHHHKLFNISIDDILKKEPSLLNFKSAKFEVIKKEKKYQLKFYINSDGTKVSENDKPNVISDRISFANKPILHIGLRSSVKSWLKANNFEGSPPPLTKSNEYIILSGLSKLFTQKLIDIEFALFVEDEVLFYYTRIYCPKFKNEILRSLRQFEEAVESRFPDTSDNEHAEPHYPFPHGKFYTTYTNLKAPLTAKDGRWFYYEDHLVITNLEQTYLEQIPKILEKSPRGLGFFAVFDGDTYLESLASDYFLGSKQSPLNRIGKIQIDASAAAGSAYGTIEFPSNLKDFRNLNNVAAKGVVSRVEQNLLFQNLNKRAASIIPIKSVKFNSNDRFSIFKLEDKRQLKIDESATKKHQLMMYLVLAITSLFLVGCGLRGIIYLLLFLAGVEYDRLCLFRNAKRASKKKKRYIGSYFYTRPQSNILIISYSIFYVFCLSYGGWLYLFIVNWP